MDTIFYGILALYTLREEITLKKKKKIENNCVMAITKNPKIISLKIVTSQLYYSNYYEISDNFTKNILVSEVNYFSRKIPVFRGK